MVFYKLKELNIKNIAYEKIIRRSLGKNLIYEQTEKRNN